MAESAVSTVAGRLGELLVQEAKFLHGVSGQIELIQLELELMQTYLEDADKRQIQDKRVQTWISKIRETAYDVEDILETFIFKIASRRRGGIKNAFKRYACIIDEAAELHQVGSQIEDIKTRITTLTRCLKTYGIKHLREGEEGPGSVIERQRQWRQSYSHVDEEYTVGLEGDIKKLVEELLNEEKQCRVVSICGMGGLGKTTLAKKIYHHKDIRRHFDCFAWAFISQQCQPRNILEGILFELISPSKEKREEIQKYKKAEEAEMLYENEREKIKDLSDEKVAEKVFHVQQEKKCLVILDDIWSPGDWDILRPAFPVGNASSKILLTTRNTEVAQHKDLIGLLHEPQCLTEKEGWDLLQKKAFPEGSDGKIDGDMKKLGAELVKRCGGLPLAIAVLGGILATKRTKDQWKRMHDNINSYLRSGKGHEQQQLGVNEILALSYDELPYQLKSCFLYLGHFPEDFNIPTKKLVRMWVAEGLVSSMQYEVKGAETLEEVAECYLGELLNRNMVQVGKRGSTGRVKTCRLHDLMREVCLSKANEENFLEIFYNQDGNEPMGGSISSMVTNAKPSHRIRRIAIQYKVEDEKFSLKRERAPYLRSLLFIHTNEYHMSLNKKKVKFCDFKLLKVLDLELCKIGKLPRVTGDLVHLRYLSFCCRAPKIPSSIGNLRFLQTLIVNFHFSQSEEPNVIEQLRRLCKMKMKRLRHLDFGDGEGEVLERELLRQTEDFILEMELYYSQSEVPDVIWKMEHLRHLCLNRSLNENRVKLQLGNLRELQTLENFDIRNFDVKELTKLTNLRKLKIVSLSSLKELEGALLISPSDNLNGLRKLFLEGKIVKLPEYSKFPPNLTKLSLSDSELEEDPMPTLGNLPNLTVLHLLSNSFKGKQMTCSAKGFPQLKSLQLNRLFDLEEWCVQEEAMRSLCTLEIDYCKKLKMVPDGLRFITTLRELHIIYMPQEFQKRVKEGGEDYHKLKHVPSIIVKS